MSQRFLSKPKIVELDKKTFHKHFLGAQFHNFNSTHEIRMYLKSNNMESTTSYVKERGGGEGEGWGARQAVVGPSGHDSARRCSFRVMVHVSLHWSRVVVGAARHL